MKTRTLMSAALILALAACAETVPTSGTEPIVANAVAMPGVVVPRNKAQIFLFRETAFAGSANAYRISINGQPVGDMAVGTKLTTLVNPGAVTVSAQTVPNILNFGFGLAMMETPSMTLTTRGGATYAIKVSPGFAGGPVLTPVSDQAAIAAATGFPPASAPR